VLPLRRGMQGSNFALGLWCRAVLGLNSKLRSGLADSAPMTTRANPDAE
jgi:hypothetical protein